MQPFLERLHIQIRKQERLTGVVCAAVSGILIVALATSCVSTGDSSNSEDIELNNDIPLPKTTPIIQVQPTPTGPNQILVATAQSEETSVQRAEATDEIPRPTTVAQQLAVEPYLGMWLTREELNRLPMAGPAWEDVKAAAEGDPGRPDLSNRSQNNNVNVLAKALVYARTGNIQFRNEVVENLMAALGTEQDGNILALGRELVAYVVAADLINLPADPEKDRIFREWLRQMLDESLDGNTLRTIHERRPNNWGAHAGASRAAVAIYLQDNDELDRTARIFMGYLGNRDIYNGFEFGKLWWQADKDNPVAINPVGAMKDSHSIDGAQPEEMRRGGKFKWPPAKTGYAWGALQGALVQAELLHRAGYLAWEWEDRALLRAVQFLYDIGWQPEGDDAWLPWLVNHAYGTDFPSSTPTLPGKNMGWTDWTHSSSRSSFTS